MLSNQEQPAVPTADPLQDHHLYNKSIHAFLFADPYLVGKIYERWDWGKLSCDCLCHLVNILSSIQNTVNAEKKKDENKKELCEFTINNRLAVTYKYRELVSEFTNKLTFK